VKQLKKDISVRVAPAGVDRQPTAEPITGKVTALTKNGRQTQVTLELAASSEKFQPTQLARLWVAQP